MMKASMKMAMEKFCSLRMAADYQDRYYIPAAQRMDQLVANDAQEARIIAAQIRRLRSLWNQIRIEPPVREKRGYFRVGENFRVSTAVYLGELRPEEVDVELYYGAMTCMVCIDHLRGGTSVPMQVQEDRGNGHFVFGCDVNCQKAGRYGFTARITARGDGRMKSTPKLITWA
jgi:starch phosphorylase